MQRKLFVIKYSVDHPRFADSARLETRVEEDGALSTVIGSPGVWCHTCGANIGQETEDRLVWVVYLGETDFANRRAYACVCSECRAKYAPYAIEKSEE